MVLDLNLPRASGRETLAEIRATPGFRLVPVVVWTSSNARVDRTQLDELGVTRYLVKPPEFQQLGPLGATIREVLEDRKTT